jgi:hypothetical protein
MRIYPEGSLRKPSQNCPSGPLKRLTLISQTSVVTEDVTIPASAVPLEAEDGH